MRELISWTLHTIPSQAYHRIVVVLDSVIRDLSFLSSQISTATERALFVQNNASVDALSLRHIRNCLGIIDSYLLDRPSTQSPEVYDDTHYLKVMAEKKNSLIPGLISILSLSLLDKNDSETSFSQKGILEDFQC